MSQPFGMGREAATHRFDQRPRDGETDTGPAVLACARLVDPIEAIEQVRQRVRRDARRVARQALAGVIRAKGGRRESDFVRLFDGHTKLRRATLNLAKATPPGPRQEG